MRTVLALLSHGYLPYSVASDFKQLETSRGLGTVVPPRRAIAASSAPEGEKVTSKERALEEAVSVHKVLETLF